MGFRLLQLFFLAWVHSATCSVEQVVQPYTAAQCADIGFKRHLMCGMCASLKDFGLQKLEEDCLKCCQKEAEDKEAKKFPSAVLEVCG